MKKPTKIWLITGTALLLIGLIIFGCEMFMLKWDFMKLQTRNFETNTYTIKEEFSSILINTDTADIEFKLADNNACKVVCYEDIKTPHSIAVEDETLNINTLDKRKWYDHIGINFTSPKITVYLPKTDYSSVIIKESTGDINIPNTFKFLNADVLVSTGNVNFLASAFNEIKIKTSTGHIYTENISAKEVYLSVSTGEIKASKINCGGDFSLNVSTGKASLLDITCKSLISNGDTGDIRLKNVIATEKFSVKRSTGDVILEGSDAKEIFIKTDTGDVKGTLLSSKVFITDTDTGSIKVPETATGGKCEITTDTGDIKIDILN